MSDREGQGGEIERRIKITEVSKRGGVERTKANEEGRGGGKIRREEGRGRKGERECKGRGIGKKEGGRR